MDCRFKYLQNNEGLVQGISAVNLEAITEACNDIMNKTVDTFLVNVTMTISAFQIEETQLRKSSIYYNIYYIGLNMIFASLLPIILLLYFNISIARELNRRPSQQVGKSGALDS